LLTSRGWWTLAIAVVMTFLGLTPIGNFAPGVAILGLALVTWMLAEFWLFATRFRAARNSILVERKILQGGRPVSTTWAKAPCVVRVSVTNTSLWRWPLVFLRDRVPEGRKVREGKPNTISELRPDVPVTWEYELRPNNAGVFRFEGVEIRLADLSGLFYRRIFLRSPLEVPILPPLSDEEGKQRADKRFNTLPPPGLHRMRRPGGGSELLDLREYQPGDPPKMIAWKASARKDKLITKEYESDVPVRTMLFLDRSESVLIGPAGATPIGKLAETASGIAQAAAATRDLVGLIRFDEETSDVMKPARTRVHTIQLLGKLAEAAGKIPDPGPKAIKDLEDIAIPLSQELYPELCDKEYNTRPWGLFWIPLLDTRWGWLAAAPVFFWMGLIFLNLSFVLNFTANVVRVARPKTGNLFIDVPLFLVTFLFAFFLPVAVFILIWFFNGIRGWWNPRARNTRKRKTLAAVFVAIDRDSPARIERYLHDQEFYASRMARFLADHHVRIPPKLYTDDGHYRYKCATKAIVLSNAILSAVSRAKDNELYVILADLTELDEAMTPILQAVRVARGRHHQVLVIVPWPDGLSTPETDLKKNQNRNRSEPAARKIAQPTSGKIIRHALSQGYQLRYERLRVELARMGAGVVRANVDDPVRVVLDRIDRLRGLRSRR
jgi:uncharacterized protein (DUF58 family)